MKTVTKMLSLATMFATIAVLQSCIFDTSERVSGNGKVKKQDREVSTFTSIEASGVFNIHLLQGAKESLSVEADENLLPLIETKVEGNTLHIDLKDHVNIRYAKKKSIYVTVKELDRLKINSVGNIQTSQKLHLKTLDLDHSGVGNVELDFDCKKLVAQIHSVGQLTLKGKAEFAEINNSSVGNTNASEFLVDTLHIHNSSVGNVEVHAEKEVYVNSSGVGNVTIAGDASVKELSSSGIGKVSKK